MVGFVRDPVIRRWIWRSEPLLIHLYPRAYEKVSISGSINHLLGALTQLRAEERIEGRGNGWFWVWRWYLGLCLGLWLRLSGSRGLGLGLRLRLRVGNRHQGCNAGLFSESGMWAGVGGRQGAEWGA